MYYYLAALALFTSLFNDIALALSSWHERMQSLIPGYGLQVSGGFNFGEKLILYFLAAWVVFSPQPKHWQQNAKIKRWFIPVCLAALIGIAECSIRYLSAQSVLHNGQSVGAGALAPLDQDLTLFGLGDTQVYFTMFAPFYGFGAGWLCRSIANRLKR
jgi:uncharacterized membrane protein YhdT